MQRGSKKNALRRFLLLSLLDRCLLWKRRDLLSLDDLVGDQEVVDRIRQLNALCDPFGDGLFLEVDGSRLWVVGTDDVDELSGLNAVSLVGDDHSEVWLVLVSYSL